MPASKITGLTDYAGGQQPADLIYIGRSPFGATDDRKNTLDNTFGIITKNVTDISISWQSGDGVSTVSAANQGKIRYSAASQQFQFSHNGGAYFGLSNIPFAVAITSNAAQAFAVGPNGTTNPGFQVVGNVASAATGVSITGRAAGAGVSLAVISSGANENLSIEPKGTGGAIVTSSGATALAVGPNGSTNPGFLVVGNVASAATGVSITGRAAGAGVSLAVISSGANENLSIEPKGTGGAIVTSSGATALAVGPNGSTNPGFLVVGNIASAATGVSITGRAAGAGVSLAVISSGTNEDLLIVPKGTGGATITSNGGAALSVGPNGATNPALLVVGNVASAATGVSITGRAAGAGVSLAVISSGTNEDLSVEPKGTGNLYLGNGITNAAPASKTINATGGSGTNIAGANILIAPGKGSGTGVPGLLLYQFPLTTASGTTLQSLSSNQFAPWVNMGVVSSTTTTVANTTTETDLMGTIDAGSKTIEAGLGRVFRLFRVIMAGTMNDTGTPTIRFQLKLGASLGTATVISDTTAVNLVAITGGGCNWEMDALFSVLVVGSSGTIRVHRFSFHYDISNGSNTLHIAPAPSSTTIDFTAAQQIFLSIIWGTANASNTITRDLTVIDMMR